MINIKLIVLLICGTAILAWACQPKPTPESMAREIVSDVNSGNTERAGARAEAFFRHSSRLDSINVAELCNLAVAMAKLSEKSEHADGFIAQAIKCYRAAVVRDSVTAVAHLNTFDRDSYKYVDMLHQLIGPITAREKGMVYSVNDMGEDEIIMPSDTALTTTSDLK